MMVRIVSNWFPYINNKHEEYKDIERYIYLKIIYIEIYMINIICAFEYSFLSRLHSRHIRFADFYSVNIVRFYLRQSRRFCELGRWWKWKSWSHLRLIVEKNKINIKPPLRKRLINMHWQRSSSQTNQIMSEVKLRVLVNMTAAKGKKYVRGCVFIYKYL